MEDKVVLMNVMERHCKWTRRECMQDKIKQDWKMNNKRACLLVVGMIMELRKYLYLLCVLFVEC